MGSLFGAGMKLSFLYPDWPLNVQPCVIHTTQYAGRDPKNISKNREKLKAGLDFGPGWAFSGEFP